MMNPASANRPTSAVSRESRRERLAEYLASRRVESKSLTSRTIVSAPKGMNKLTFERFNKSKTNSSSESTSFQPRGVSSLNQETQNQKITNNRNSWEEDNPKRTPVSKTSVQSSLNSSKKNLNASEGVEKHVQSVSKSSNDVFRPASNDFELTPQRNRTPTAQPTGLLSHFKAKNGSAQKSLAFGDSSPERSSRLHGSAMKESTKETPSSHFKRRQSSNFEQATEPTPQRLDLNFDAVENELLRTPPKSTVKRVSPPSHFKNPKQSAKKHDFHVTIPSNLDSDTKATPETLSLKDMMNQVELNSDSGVGTRTPSSHFKAPEHSARKSPSFLLHDSPARVLFSTTATEEPVVNSTAGQAFPMEMQALLRQYLDDALYTSKFSLAGARVVLADIPTHIPLAPQKAIFWLAKANVEEMHKAIDTAHDVYAEALRELQQPLERLIIEAAYMEFESRIKATCKPMKIIVPNQKTELTPEKQREFCAHLLEGTHEDSFIMAGSSRMIP